MSGSFTVWLQPRTSLWPMVGNPEPKKEAPLMFQPSSLWTCPSYHWPTPKKGWWGLIKSMAWPSELLAGVMAHMLEPCDSEARDGLEGLRQLLTKMNLK